MKKYKVQILTEEYSVNVFIGTKDECVREGARYTSFSQSNISDDFQGRGCAYCLYPKKHPLILIDGSLDKATAIATLAHEANHAMDYLMGYVKINSDEFRSHGIAAILRTVLKSIIKIDSSRMTHKNSKQA